ncbi:MAG: NERD domain-containing protein [Gammaproteobacteria bacterium]|nr:NERD domain-containing protein [Gammaproteobacteria bacterium]
MPEVNPFAPLIGVLTRNALWVIPIVVSLSAFRALLPRLKGAIGEAMVGSILNGLFNNVLHDIIVQDGRGGLTQIDHVALTGAGLAAWGTGARACCVRR